MKLPDFSFEKKLWRKGYRVVAGVDEVGRGAFAGPVVAAAVAFAPNSKQQTLNSKIKINDSKQLNSKRRERAYFWIRKNALCYGIGKASVAQINKFGIKKATEIAFRKAIKSASIRVSGIQYLLIDAFYIPYVRGLRRKNQLAIINGDEKSVSIAAASIIAKVYRDKLMRVLSRGNKKYHWDKNKGYGTKKHQKAIKKYGATRLHRNLFIRNFVSSQV